MDSQSPASVGPPLKAGPSHRRGVLLVALGCALALAGCGEPKPPRELSQLQAVTDQLLRANAIRTTPIRFALEAGETAPYWAQKAGLCKASKQEKESGDACEHWAHLSPAEAETPVHRQINRLSYLLGTASARTYAHGLISFDRSFFLVHEDDPGALRCVVAHELTHFLRRHAFLSSRAANGLWKDLPEQQRHRALARLSRQQELAADRNAMLMTAIAGHDPVICVQQLQNGAQLDADYAPEAPLETHPGYSRRLSAARAYLQGPLQRDLAAWRKAQANRGERTATAPRWSWDPGDQLLTVRTLPEPGPLP
ncbi:M48 family metallopeptidase [Cyanobium sp. ATX 6F1]|uniref:M48 family metallopeptidase n=1 Tax=unclassified Cyanobium TaxID=2627006 RepID=UPI0020CDC38D|nr:M48 family metallopeptidase [Cyanobium sp. ATX 6F1]MCP9915540.1 M48 family metalloprotease [Cyanobium sp. ATX 6F1]